MYLFSIFSIGPTCTDTLLPALCILLCNQEEKVVGKHHFYWLDSQEMSLLWLYLPSPQVTVEFKAENTDSRLAAAGMQSMGPG